MRLAKAVLTPRYVVFGATVVAALYAGDTSSCSMCTSRDSAMRYVLVRRVLRDGGGELAFLGAG